MYRVKGLGGGLVDVDGVSVQRIESICLGEKGFEGV